MKRSRRLLPGLKELLALQSSVGFLESLIQSGGEALEFRNALEDTVRRIKHLQATLLEAHVRELVVARRIRGTKRALGKKWKPVVDFIVGDARQLNS